MSNEKPKHTPGPHYFAPDGYHSYVSPDKPEHNGRAQLFPDKVSALVHLVASLEGEKMQYDRLSHKFKLAIDEAAAELALERAAIAKATGEE